MRAEGASGPAGRALRSLADLSSSVVLHADEPVLPLLLFLLLVAGAAPGLVFVVLRALLRQAADLRTDMEAVI